MSAQEATTASSTTESADTRVGTDKTKDEVSWHLYKGVRFGPPPKRDGRCEGQTYFKVGRFGEWRQCEVTGKLEYGGHRWCGRHHPPTVDAKKKARTDEWQRQSEADSARYRQAIAEGKQKDAALEAIKQIAAGHNDPRGLAMAVLAAPSPTTED